MTMMRQRVQDWDGDGLMIKIERGEGEGKEKKGGWVGGKEGEEQGEG